MKIADPQRLILAAYPVRREITTRVGDLDSYGHLNAIRIGQYYEDARAAFYGVAFPGVDRGRSLVAQITTRFLGEGFWPNPLVVGTGITRIGASSFEMSQGLFQDGRCLGLCETVLVNVEKGASAPLPDDVRACLEQMRFATEPAPA
jgi:acyl-CoA thioester hydrolase